MNSPNAFSWITFAIAATPNTPIQAKSTAMKKIKQTNLPKFLLPTQLLIQLQ